MVTVACQKTFLNSNNLVLSNSKLVVNKYVSNNYNASGIIRLVGFVSYSQSNSFESLITVSVALYLHGYFHDYLSSLTRFFGEGFKQDANYVHINKLALPGLVPHANNTAESILAALLLRVKDYESNNLISSICISFWKSEYITKNNTSYFNQILLINLYAVVKYSYSFPVIGGVEHGFILNADEKPTVSEF